MSDVFRGSRKHILGNLGTSVQSVLGSIRNPGSSIEKLADFPGETFRGLKEKEEKQYGDSAEQLYKRRSNRMILGAF